jgi:stearoyl-CoA desaturase (delta-9 desaturase)
VSNLAKLKTRIIDSNWITQFFMAAFHIGAVLALFYFSWQGLLAAVVLWWISCGMGIGMGYHRLLTHRSYKAPKWLEYLLTIFATLALEGGPIFWVATHRVHHKFTDVPGDPHSPRDGKWWSHMGWILSGKALAQSTSELAPHVPDLINDKFHVWISRYHWVPLTTLGFSILAIWGWPIVFWTIFLRVTVGLHGTWLVNSANHLWGSQRFATGDDSTNNFWVALVTFGEGWHNNHHAHPTSARHGLAWYEIDHSWILISIFKFFGIAKSVKVASIRGADAAREAA